MQRIHQIQKAIRLQNPIGRAQRRAPGTVTSRRGMSTAIEENARFAAAGGRSTGADPGSASAVAGALPGDWLEEVGDRRSEVLEAADAGVASTTVRVRSANI